MRCNIKADVNISRSRARENLSFRCDKIRNEMFIKRGYSQKREIDVCAVSTYSRESLENNNNKDNLYSVKWKDIIFHRSVVIDSSNRNAD